MSWHGHGHGMGMVCTYALARMTSFSSKISVYLPWSISRRSRLCSILPIKAYSRRETDKNENGVHCRFNSSMRCYLYPARSKSSSNSSRSTSESRSGSLCLSTSSSCLSLLSVPVPSAMEKAIVDGKDITIDRSCYFVFANGMNTVPLAADRYTR
jgi:hypothetical protein